MTIEPDDRDLVQECLGGDEHAFEILLVRYKGPVFNAVLRMVRDRDDALDLTQTAFLKAYEQLTTFDPRHKFFSWLYRIAINEALNHVKRRSRTEPLAGDWPAAIRSPEEEILGADLSRRVQEALMRIPPDGRAVLVLRHFLDCSYADIAATIGIPEKTVKSRLFEARRQLRDLLEAKGMMR
ncbi:MAG TPA: sigma-70 family RNA polymerase sigma factor [Candidatus Polarisedimenticolaceae bacterium]|nr:sigma-70 family RNA polymerase sigma factor [Candidatus Polarisedimenticolaceae bacterium]